jgi:hypothetical protein
LEEQKKNTGLAYWACRPCIVYAQGITKRVQEIEKRLETVEERTKMTVENVGKLEQRVEKIGGQQDKMGEKLDRKIEQSENRIFEELRERDAKKLNIIMHGVKEAAGGERSGERRAAWDMEKIVEVFVFLELGLTEEDVKFCRRVGERGEAPRALVVGFHTEAARGQILRYAKYLAETDYEHISILPDLTRRQRLEESNMDEEVRRRNEEELTEDDVAKNLCWKVVGQRGEKRMIKGYSRGAGGHGAGTRAGTRGRGRWTARGGGGARGRAGARGSGWGERRETAAKRTRISSESDTDQPPPTRARGGSRGGYRRSMAATGSNRIALGARKATQQQAGASEESGTAEQMEEETSEPVEGEAEVGVRVGVGEAESDVEETPSQRSQQC